jgi:hypothetical protein
LPTITDYDESRPQGNLSLAEPNISTDQAIHWSVRDEVSKHLGDCLLLVGGFVKWETVTERGIVIFRDVECSAPSDLPEGLGF